MARLFILLALLIALALSCAALLAAWRHIVPPQDNEDALMPNTLKKMSYVLLIVLLFGVVTGWLGAT